LHPLQEFFNVIGLRLANKMEKQGVTQFAGFLLAAFPSVSLTIQLSLTTGLTVGRRPGLGAFGFS